MTWRAFSARAYAQEARDAAAAAEEAAEEAALQRPRSRTRTPSGRLSARGGDPSVFAAAAAATAVYNPSVYTPGPDGGSRPGSARGYGPGGGSAGDYGGVHTDALERSRTARDRTAPGQSGGAGGGRGLHSSTIYLKVSTVCGIRG